jgi:hypothetical protein
MCPEGRLRDVSLEGPDRALDGRDIELGDLAERGWI